MICLGLHRLARRRLLESMNGTYRFSSFSRVGAKTQSNSPTTDEKGENKNLNFAISQVLGSIKVVHRSYGQ